ncbi:MAG TPA: LysR family transcriptional regulator [Vicinamibacterales bacterium]|nr:LysR family transcriptional regulator [Vicinamibacterales bacterium]
MNLRHVRAFVVVAEELSFTNAARRLHISQPPLSRQIQQLEREVGAKLFIRRPQRIELTDRGSLLLEEARRLGAIADEFLETAQSVKRRSTGVVRIGMSWGLWSALNRVRTRYTKDHPDVEITIEDLCLRHDSMSSADAFRRQRIDIALTRASVEAPGIDNEPLFDERIVMLAREDHPLARSRSVGLCELAKETLLMFERKLNPALYDKVLEMYAAAGVAPRIVHTKTSPYEQAGLMLIATGEGIFPSISSKFTQPHAAMGVTPLSLSEPHAVIPVMLSWRNDECSPAIREFVSATRQAFATSPKNVTRLVVNA